ncbi:hypothetical protein N9F76_00955 [bacterium]|nr:hypothetical protein [bacterium]
MTFTLLSTVATLIGIGVIALALGLLQRLRVQHREIEVVSTLFWQAAVKETRARVFVQRFRHWPAWLLLVVIATLLWLLLAGPRWTATDQMQHVVLLDGSVADPDVVALDLEIASAKASKLPLMNREIVHAGPRLETLLRRGEPVQLAKLRLGEESIPTSTGLEWALDLLAARVAAGTPLTVHIVGDAELDQRYLDSLPADVSVYRVMRGAVGDKPLFRSLGVSNSASGVWQTVDLLFAPSSSDKFDVDKLEITIDGKPLSDGVRALVGGEFVIEDVPARGGALRFAYQGREEGAITLPKREAITIAFEAGTPEVLKELILLDPACREVESNPDLVVGESGNADFCLVPVGQAAFQIDTVSEDAQSALAVLIDELALRQIDATGLAEQSGRVVDVQVAAAQERRISLWKNLFTSTFNFQQSRACPIFVARSIRWLAGRPALIPWVEQGMRLPVARPAFERVADATARSNDGRTLQVTRLTRPVLVAGLVEESPRSSVVAGVGIAVWIGVVAIFLLLTEWALYQRGRLP